jgi:hypothetical protein
MVMPTRERLELLGSPRSLIANVRSAEAGRESFATEIDDVLSGTGCDALFQD